MTLFQISFSMILLLKKEVLPYIIYTKPSVNEVVNSFRLKTIVLALISIQYISFLGQQTEKKIVECYLQFSSQFIRNFSCCFRFLCNLFEIFILKQVTFFHSAKSLQLLEQILFQRLCYPKCFVFHSKPYHNDQSLSLENFLNITVTAPGYITTTKYSLSVSNHFLYEIHALVKIILIKVLVSPGGLRIKHYHNKLLMMHNLISLLTF